ncbi:hypothetical protein B0H19DRAFT_1060295 [Mycena capillaripes]|nr:hypothetical protein B0H19DRAFT_1060295 [Mycena capillaripes]
MGKTRPRLKTSAGNGSKKSPSSSSGARNSEGGPALRRQQTLREVEARDNPIEAPKSMKAKQNEELRLNFSNAGQEIKQLSGEESSLEFSAHRVSDALSMHESKALKKLVQYNSCPVGNSWNVVMEVQVAPASLDQESHAMTAIIETTGIVWFAEKSRRGGDVRSWVIRASGEDGGTALIMTSRPLESTAR